MLKRIVLIVFVTLSFIALLPSKADSQTSGWVWGADRYGELGNNTVMSAAPYGVSTPILLNGFSDALSMAGGGLNNGGHTLGLKNDGSVWSCGNDTYGQLGNGTAGGNYPYIGPVTGLPFIYSAAAGEFHSAALSVDGTVWSWGYNGSGQLGNSFSPPTSSVPLHINGLSNVVAIACGLNHSAALKADGSVWVWGDNTYGQLGRGNFLYTSTAPIPTQVSGLTNVVAISCGAYDTYALKGDGTVWGWGKNDYGQLGTGSYSSAGNPPWYNVGIPVPVKVLGMNNVIAIAAGGMHCLALKKNGIVWSWGENDYGQLGNGNALGAGTNPGIAIPNQVNVLTNVTHIAAGFLHSLALKSDGTVWSWGYNIWGQVGNGSFGGPTGNNGIATPTQTINLSNVIAISSNSNHSMAVTGTQLITEDFHGKIKLQGWAGANPTTAYVSIDGLAAQTVTVTNNQFTVTTTPGPHTINVRLNGFLAQKLPILLTSNTPLTNYYGPSGNGLIPGDTNNDGVIDDQDLLSVINHFLVNTSIGDTNGDGVVNDIDLLNVINSFLVAGDV